MADIHGVPSEDMMVPLQTFTSEPLPSIPAAESGMPKNVEPPGDVRTPVQGKGTYPGTT